MEPGDEGERGIALVEDNGIVTLAISDCYQDNEGTAKAGLVVVYRSVDRGDFTILGELKGTQENGKFGISVALSPDGNTLAVGSGGSGYNLQPAGIYVYTDNGFEARGDVSSDANGLFEIVSDNIFDPIRHFGNTIAVAGYNSNGLCVAVGAGHQQNRVVIYCQLATEGCRLRGIPALDGIDPCARTSQYSCEHDRAKCHWGSNWENEPDHWQGWQQERVEESYNIDCQNCVEAQIDVCPCGALTFTRVPDCQRFCSDDVSSPQYTCGSPVQGATCLMDLYTLDPTAYCWARDVDCQRALSNGDSLAAGRRLASVSYIRISGSGGSNSDNDSGTELGTGGIVGVVVGGVVFVAICVGLLVYFCVCYTKEDAKAKGKSTGTKPAAEQLNPEDEIARAQQLVAAEQTLELEAQAVEPTADGGGELSDWHETHV